MRNEAYDQKVREAIDIINKLPQEELTTDVLGIRDALNVVLAETDETKLAQYYKNIEEFIFVNVGKGLEYMNGEYLINHE